MGHVKMLKVSIFFKRVTNSEICIVLNDGMGICELSFMPFIKDSAMEDYGINTETENTFYFNRLKVHDKFKNMGVGTFLMNQLISILDKNGIFVWNELNPYDGKSKEVDLIRFYKRFGFEIIPTPKIFSPVMIRKVVTI